MPRHKHVKRRPKQRQPMRERNKVGRRAPTPRIVHRMGGKGLTPLFRPAESVYLCDSDQLDSGFLSSIWPELLWSRPQPQEPKSSHVEHSGDTFLTRIHIRTWGRRCWVCSTGQGNHFTPLPTLLSSSRFRLLAGRRRSPESRLSATASGASTILDRGGTWRWFSSSCCC